MATSLTTLTGLYNLNGNGSLDVGGTITKSGTTATYTAGEELGGFKSGSISFDASTVDNSARGDGGWAVNSPGSRSATIELTWNKLEGDDGQDCLTGMLTQASADWATKGVAIRYQSANGNPTTSGTIIDGFFGVFVPTAYSENQTGGGDADGTAVECSMTLASNGEIYSFTQTVS